MVGARLVDRVGKGIRGAPRDALIADLTPKDARGAAYGLRQALDTVGAMAGPLLAIGALAWFAGDLVLAQANAAGGVLVGAGLWGLHLALTQGLLSALVAGVAPADLRGTAFGVFNFACGAALLVASALAGSLWNAIDPAATFYAGAALTAFASVGLLAYRRHLPALA